MYKSKRDRTERGSSPITKRSRSSLGRYNEPDSDDDRGGRGARSPGGRGRERGDYYDGSSSRVGGYKESGYKESGYKEGGYKDGGYKDTTYKDGPGYKDGSGGYKDSGSGYKGTGSGYKDTGSGYKDTGSGYKDGSYRDGSYKDSSGYDSRHHSSSSGSGRTYEYKVLCISAIHAKASDDFVRETLYREFKRYGDISVKVVHEPDERVAYVYFRSYEDAREAKHSKARITIYEKPIIIEAAYESSSTTSNSNYRPQESYGDRGGYGGSGSGNYTSRRSPHPQLPPTYDRGHRDDHRGGGFDRYHGPPPHQGGPPPHYIREDYRRGPGEPRDFPGTAANRGHQQQPQVYPPRYERMDRFYNNNSDNYNPITNNSNRYPIGPPQPRGLPMPPPHERPPYENKKDKFPNYLHHIAPEDDPLATRTLFAGNLEVNITDEEMRRIFGRYGTVEDIDIKRPPPGTGNAFAFVRFANLDMASRAKSELSGQYIGKFQCKIGYGKVNPTTKIWVGGLGPWATMAQIEREFDRFGSIKKIDWVKGEHQCFITYETIDAAQAAVKDMRGYALGGPDKRVRTDFAGVEQVVGYAGKFEEGGVEVRDRDRKSSNFGQESEDGPPPNYSPHSTDNAESLSESESNAEKRKEEATRNAPVSSPTKSVTDIPRKEKLGWHGSLVLKNSAFPTRFYLTDGDLENVNVLLKDEEGKDKLRITQRLRLDQTKLDDVTKRIEAAPGYAIFLSWPSTGSPLTSPNVGPASPTQSRPLKNLVSYLKQKEAAGVISLANKSLDLTGVLYAFPPCPFSLELLHKSRPDLEDTKEDYLVVVVIRGGTP